MTEGIFGHATLDVAETDARVITGENTDAPPPSEDDPGASCWQAGSWPVQNEMAGGPP